MYLCFKTYRFGMQSLLRPLIVAEEVDWNGTPTAPKTNVTKSLLFVQFLYVESPHKPFSQRMIGIRCNIVDILLTFRAASSAASFTKLARSAPVNPIVLPAIADTSRSLSILIDCNKPRV